VGRRGQNIIEHFAGIEDFEVAEATYRVALKRWPKAVITLRQDARVIHADAMKDKCRTYTPRIVGDKVMMPAVLKRLRLNTSALSLMRCARWSKSYGPSWHTSCRRRGREAELIPRPVSVHHRKTGSKRKPRGADRRKTFTVSRFKSGDRADRKLLACEHGIGSGKVS
jgi:hypothetical protein